MAKMYKANRTTYKTCIRGHIKSPDNLYANSSCKMCHTMLRKRTGRPRGGARISAALPYGMASFKRLFTNYKHGATKRNLVFELTEEEFYSITKKTCHYCGVEPRQVYRLWTGGNNKYSTPYVYNGIDRVNNDEGYVKENVVPCCKFCNQAKSNFSLEEFLSWVDRLVKFRQS